ncbi:hypothetical protein CLF_105761 [Clonorchis sinensis]|uniref:C2H2-type domain-containing protein n=1 Tax=Clonorchis sinensis TaxID=79923 RepID=G7YE59_CLOSI|nr:hypothetical protein CLF_105761 [Clonorchis sinensis]
MPSGVGFADRQCTLYHHAACCRQSLHKTVFRVIYDGLRKYRYDTQLIYGPQRFFECRSIDRCKQAEEFNQSTIRRTLRVQVYSGYCNTENRLKLISSRLDQPVNLPNWTDKPFIAKTKKFLGAKVNNNLSNPTKMIPNQPQWFESSGSHKVVNFREQVVSNYCVEEIVPMRKNHKREVLNGVHREHTNRLTAEGLAVPDVRRTYQHRLLESIRAVTPSNVNSCRNKIASSLHSAGRRINRFQVKVSVRAGREVSWTRKATEIEEPQKLGMPFGQSTEPPTALSVRLEQYFPGLPTISIKTRLRVFNWQAQLNESSSSGSDKTIGQTAVYSSEAEDYVVWFNPTSSCNGIRKTSPSPGIHPLRGVESTYFDVFHQAWPNRERRTTVIDSVYASIVSSMFSRVRALCTEEIDRTASQIETANRLQEIGYPVSLIRRQLRRISAPVSRPSKEWVGTAVIPYKAGTSEVIRRVLNSANIRVAFQKGKTLCSVLVRSKEPLPVERTRDCVYKINCNNCTKVYIGQTARELHTRIGEHKRRINKPPKNAIEYQMLVKDSAMVVHALDTGHTIDLDNVEVLRQGLRFTPQRLIAEAVENIKHHSVNRIEGVELASIWKAVFDKRS